MKRLFTVITYKDGLCRKLVLHLQGNPSCDRIVAHETHVNAPNSGQLCAQE